MIELTGSQKLVINYIKKYLCENHNTPTMSNIARHFGWKSSSSAHQHMNALLKKGYLEYGDDRRVKLSGCKVDLNEV
jgi:repressor LexA